MKYEKIIDQPDGSKIKATVVFYDNDYSRKSNYRIELKKCDKGKRTWYQPYDNDSHNFRALSIEDRANKIKRDVIEILGKENYNDCLLEAWQQLKPTLI